MYDDYFVVIKIFDFDFDFGNSPITDELTTQRQVTRSFDVFCAWINSWINNRDAGDLRRHHVHYDVTIMEINHEAPEQ